VREGGLEMGLFDDLKAANIALKQAQDDIEDIKKKIIETLCPIKVGDIVVIDGHGWYASYEGQKMKVTRVILGKDGYKDDYEWRIIGNVLNKDGKAGNRTSNFRMKIEGGSND